MQIIHRAQTKEFKNNELCTAIEYPLKDKDINGAVIKLNGRYPDKGCVMNTVCKELAFVLKGEGKVTVNGKESRLNQNDLLFILPGEKYFFEGNLEMFMPCSPSWYPEQHKVVE